MLAEERVLPLFPPAVHQVVSFVDLGQQHLDIGRIVLQVAVHRHNHVARGELQAGLHGCRLAVIAAKTDDLHASVRGRQRRGQAFFHPLDDLAAASG